MQSTQSIARTKMWKERKTKWAREAVARIGDARAKEPKTQASWIGSTSALTETQAKAVLTEIIKLVPGAAAVEIRGRMEAEMEMGNNGRRQSALD